MALTERSPAARVQPTQNGSKRTLRARVAQAGQTLPLVVVFMFTILIFAGLVIDLGNAYRVQQALQASADASAAGGAGELTMTYPPIAANATAAAVKYGSQSGGENPITGVPAANVTQSVTVDCERQDGFNCTSGEPEHGHGRRDGEGADVPAQAARVRHHHAQGARPGMLAVRRPAARRDDRARPHRIDGRQQQAPAGQGRDHGLPEHDGSDGGQRRPRGAPAGALDGRGMHRRRPVLQRQSRSGTYSLANPAYTVVPLSNTYASARRPAERRLTAGLDRQLRPGGRQHRLRRGARRRLRGAAGRRPAGRAEGDRDPLRRRRQHGAELSCPARRRTAPTRAARASPAPARPRRPGCTSTPSPTRRTGTTATQRSEQT